MQTHYYKVAGLFFSFTLPTGDGIEQHISNYAPFEVEENKNLLFHLDVLPWDEQAEALSQRDISGEHFARFDEEDKIITLYKLKSEEDPSLSSENKISPYDFHFFSKVSKHENLGFLKVTDNFRKGVLWAKGSMWARHFAFNNSLMMMFAFAAADKGVLLQHASVIKLHNRSYCFLGKSGTGKSTHSSLWLKNIADTELLNDDNPAIKIEQDGTPCTYGTPWSGKTPCYKNDFAPLGGFVDLEQAPYNKIRKLSVIGAYAALLPTFSNLKWEKVVADGVNETIATLIKKVQVFHLECLPDAEAAFTSYNALTGKEIASENPSVSTEKERFGDGNEASGEKEDTLDKSNDLQENRTVAKGYEIFDAIANLVDEDKTVKLTVRGNSMLPFIFNGRDQVELKKEKVYKVGDIVLARYEDRFVLHRIWKFEGDYVILHGDGNKLSKKEKLPVKDIVAKAIAIYFNGKKKLTDAPWQKFKYKVWEILLPFRRIWLGFYRRTPYYKKYTKLVAENSNNRKKQ